MSIFVKPCPQSASRDDRTTATNRCMALSKTEWKRRVDAALVLRGEELGDLKQPVHEKGLPVNAAARAGHDSDSYLPSHALALVVAEITELPVAWFEDEDWRQLISEARAAGPDQEIEALTQQRSVLISTVLQVRTELERLQKLLPPGEQPTAQDDSK
jgi:hypothetical protein